MVQQVLQFLYVSSSLIMEEVLVGTTQSSASHEISKTEQQTENQKPSNNKIKHWLQTAKTQYQWGVRKGVYWSVVLHCPRDSGGHLSQVETEPWSRYHRPLLFHPHCQTELEEIVESEQFIQKELQFACWVIEKITVRRLVHFTIRSALAVHFGELF